PFFLILRSRRPPRSPLCPYTTLFRSFWASSCKEAMNAMSASACFFDDVSKANSLCSTPSLMFSPEETPVVTASAALDTDSTMVQDRKSTTSELQSRENLVCRLLLEKK